MESGPLSEDPCPSFPFLEEPFSLAELNIAIDAVRASSSPGLDGVDYGVFQFLSEDLRKSFLFLVNDLYRLNLFPPEWRLFSLFLIPKKGSSKFR